MLLLKINEWSDGMECSEGMKYTGSVYLQILYNMSFEQINRLNAALEM